MVWLFNFCGVQFFVDFIMIIYEVVVSYTWCLRYIICSTWFLDIRISTCSVYSMQNVEKESRWQTETSNVPNIKTGNV